ncbi:MAG: hypothetical protein AMJ53_14875 [Gammaproteobacteria bacterium SG8_11]|nr:MAG: hypothetical protein AMJ53_14875 [Gammaproteobacteria bacterium SG8_11]
MRSVPEVKIKGQVICIKTFLHLLGKRFTKVIEKAVQSETTKDKREIKAASYLIKNPAIPWRGLQSTLLWKRGK